jgi:hypothetical protein
MDAVVIREWFNIPLNPTRRDAGHCSESQLSGLLQRRYSRPVDKATGVRSDHTVILTAIDSAKPYPDALRRVGYLDVETGKRFKFLTNNFTLPALTIARIYKARWQVVT